MSQKRKAKLKKREERRQRVEQSKHDLVDAALRHAGVYEAFRRLTPRLQNSWRGLLQPAPEIVFDASAEGSEHALGIQREFPEFLRTPFTSLGRPVNSLEMLCYLTPLKMRAEALVKHFQATGQDVGTAPLCHVLAFATQLSAFMQQHETLVQHDFTGFVWSTMLYNTQLDERIMWSTYDHRLTRGGKFVLQIVLHRKVPERVKLTVDDRPRTAFRCYVPFIGVGLQEINWNARAIGFADDPRDLPVYMHGHALEQLEQRAPSSKPIYHIVTSFLVPKFLRTSDDHFLVEYRHMNDKLGYFVGVRLSDCVLLKTFLFLTMQGTPESDLLYRKLRLTRSDIEYMKLDELSAFRDNEVRSDPLLVTLLNECGCGHLLTLTAPDLPMESPTGYAETLRKYLGTLDKFASRLPTPALDPASTDLAGLTLWGKKL